MVSVIIPTYNRASFLDEAISSVLRQDLKDFELIVVDDGSTDSTQEILAQYQDIRIIRKTHQGVSAARNAGIAFSRGDLISFLDSDDLWLPEKLSVQVEFFKSHPSALICQTEEIWVRNGTRIYPKKRHKKFSGMIFEASLRLCIVSPSAVMMRKSFFDRVGYFDETLPACEDYDLWLRTAARIPIHLIETPLVIKRGGHKDQLSQIGSLDRFRIRSLQKILESGILDQKKYSAALEVLKEKCNIYGMGCIKRGRIEEGNYYLRLPTYYQD
nr:glycosyltransferase [Desulfobacterales bacterium]